MSSIALSTKPAWNMSLARPVRSVEGHRKAPLRGRTVGCEWKTDCKRIRRVPARSRGI